MAAETPRMRATLSGYKRRMNALGNGPHCFHSTARFTETQFMITSPKTQSTSFLDEIRAGEPIPAHKLAYFEQRAVNNFHETVLRKFIDSKLKKSELAKRVGLSQPQINRYLLSPNNWTIATVQRLMIGIAAEEVFLRGESFLDRNPQNRSVLDLLDELETLPPVAPSTGSSGQVKIIELERV